MNAFFNTSRCLRVNGSSFGYSLGRTTLQRVVTQRAWHAVRHQSQAAAANTSRRIPQVRAFGFRELLGDRNLLVKALGKAFPDVKRPTLSQAEFIPAILKGQDVVLQDETGTGKSFGTILALLSKSRAKASSHTSGRPNRPCITSLVIVPHRDLGFQMLHWITAILKNSGTNSPALETISQLVVRGDTTSPNEQARQLYATPPHILIGTPQALWEIYQEDREALQIEDLATLVIDEVDYLLDVPAPYLRKKREEAAWKNFRKHPSAARLLLEEILPRRKPGAVPLAEVDYNDDDDRHRRSARRRGVSGRPLQVLVSSATVHSNLTDYLWEARWMGDDRVVISGKQVAKTNAHIIYEDGKDEPEVVHHAFVVSASGNVSNVDFAVRPGEEHLKKDKKDRRTGYQETTGQSQLLPPNAAVQKAIAELHDLGVNARTLDLRSESVSQLGRPGGLKTAESEATLLVATPAYTRGVDLPQLTHVFCVGPPDLASADSFKHVSGRVDRFGRGGKIITFVTEREEEHRDGMVRTTKNPAGLLRMFYRKLGIKPVWFDLMTSPLPIRLFASLALLFILFSLLAHLSTMGAAWQHCRLLFALAVLAALLQLSFVHAQSSTPAPSSSSSTSPAPSSLANASISSVVSNFTSTFTSTSGVHTTVITSVIPTTVALSPTSTSANATATNSTNSASATPLSLDTRVDPGYGVLGAILIITGLPSAFWGHKNRWSSFFLIGFYTLALACLALILKFGVLEAVNLPSEKLRGVFVLACCIAGIAGGGVAIFFWHQAKYFIGAWGGFAFGLWIQCFRDGGLIRPIGFRWILYTGKSQVIAIADITPDGKYRPRSDWILFMHASKDPLPCASSFYSDGLKEFYIWNLGFDTLFTKFTNNGIEFPISQMMEIELGLIGAFALMGAAVQLRILKILQFKLKEISRDQKKRDEELEAQAASRFTLTAKEMEAWDKEHGRVDSHLSGLPLLKEHEAQSSGTEENSTLVFGDHRRSRYQSGISDYMASPQTDDRQQTGALPAIDLGLDLESDIPKDFVSDHTTSLMSNTLTPQEREGLKKKEALMVEISTIRKSIEQLHSATPGSSAEDESRSRHQSFTSRRTLSVGFVEAMEGPSRPPRAADPRTRVQSMERLSQYPDALMSGSSISRPSSAPLQDDAAWNDYVRERKLFQPPAGVSPPIVTAPIAPQPKRASVAVPAAVSEAILRRHQQEAAIESGGFGSLGRHDRLSSHTSEERPLSKMFSLQQKSVTVGSKAPVTILPPRRPNADQQPVRPSAPRTRTFEELAERHREKMRDLQAPLSQAEREQAELAAARSRWEHSKEVERQVMTKKQAEKEVAAKQRREEKDEKRLSVNSQHQRSLSADKLGKLPGASGLTSKRQSMLKVEDWRRYQQDVEVMSPAQPSSRRDSVVPFPAAQASREPGRVHSPSNDRCRSQLMPPS
ncbi:hypothetical protein EW145_g3823 [Phellinidium pouzarii]|uniref:Helicase ATP-binding domain-containing protein n=1 Tax=Phellinidium pouzarii TaxID=167371 RepID=A0A4S4L5R8_9AGAM|nr:hypothetical protein EW145_g3823 [Phellinidium pouzarii]